MSKYRVPINALRALTAALSLAAACSIPTAVAQDAGEAYARLLADVDSLARHNAYLQQTIELQRQRLESIQAEIVALDETGAQAAPLLERMYNELEAFVAADLPFIDPSQASADHRADRMAKLRELMADAETPQGEKYRRIMEACQIEIEYGRTIASYKAKLPDGREANFVRVGRISLMYRTTGEEPETGYWDMQKKSWVVENDYADAVDFAIQVATKVKAPDLLPVPVPAPSEVRS